MSEFTLPANSKVGKGKHWPAPQQDALVDAILGMEKLPDSRTLIERLRVKA